MPISNGYSVGLHHTEHTLLFDPSERGLTFLTHCGTRLPQYTASQSRRAVILDTHLRENLEPH